MRPPRGNRRGSRGSREIDGARPVVGEAGEGVRLVGRRHDDHVREAVAGGVKHRRIVVGGVVSGGRAKYDAGVAGGRDGGALGAAVAAAAEGGVDGHDIHAAIPHGGRILHRLDHGRAGEVRSVGGHLAPEARGQIGVGIVDAGVDHGDNGGRDGGAAEWPSLEVTDVDAGGSRRAIHRLARVLKAPELAEEGVVGGIRFTWPAEIVWLGMFDGRVLAEDGDEVGRGSGLGSDQPTDPFAASGEPIEMSGECGSVSGGHATGSGDAGGGFE